MAQQTFPQTIASAPRTSSLVRHMTPTERVAWFLAVLAIRAVASCRHG